MSLRLRIDGLTLVGLGFIGFMALNVLHDQGFVGEPGQGILSPRQGEAVQTSPVEVSAGTGDRIKTEPPVQAESVPDYDSDIIVAPYESFIVTQGPHGFDYGHMAVDISAGKGVTIRSSINGTVTNLYIDDWGNPSLVLENEHYIVELLHGKFTVQIGDRVELGQSIGRESNLGNIADVNGRPCQQFDCGYHTHINVYDKQLGTNVNPLDLFGN